MPAISACSRNHIHRVPLFLCFLMDLFGVRESQFFRGAGTFACGRKLRQSASPSQKSLLPPANSVTTPICDPLGSGIGLTACWGRCGECFSQRFERAKILTSPPILHPLLVEIKSTADERSAASRHKRRTQR